MTPQTKRRKFIKNARDEAFQKGKQHIKDKVEPWFAELKHFAKKKDWKRVLNLILNGLPYYPTIECTADITRLFTIAQHELDRQFSSIEGHESVWDGMKPETGMDFAQAVINRGNETFQKPQ